jgi:ribonuclease VapC
MILDSSAIVTMLRRELGFERLEAALAGADEMLVSAATWLETSMVLDLERDPLLNRKFEAFLEEYGVLIVPVSLEQARIARNAHRDFGKRSGHRARLNLGDLFSYALAIERRQPLLFVGDDFIHTDIEPAVII